MDRFIENIAEYQSMFAEYLKSNMDRFIAQTNVPENYGASVFKIQYG